LGLFFGLNGDVLHHDRFVGAILAVAGYFTDRVGDFLAFDDLAEERVMAAV
jgi:hypothetical protein